MNKTEKETKAQLIKLANKEAINLKKYATKKELANLNFDKLDPNERKECVYGQLTGECNSKRATKLIKKCATKVLFPREAKHDFDSFGNTPMETYVVGGKPKKRRATEFNYVSPIEAVIVRYPKKTKGLIDFLTGKKEYFIKNAQP